MPTTNPRIQITLKPEQYELLTRLSKAQRRPRSAVLLELLETVTPMLERVVVALEAAHRTQVMAREGFRESIEKAEAAILPHVAAAMGQFDLLIDAAQRDEPQPASGAPSLPLPASPEGTERLRSRAAPASPSPRARRDRRRGKAPVPVIRGPGRGVKRPHKAGRP